MDDVYGREILSDYYVSNCVIEAVKAKIHDRRVRIVKRHVKGAILPHFLWGVKGSGYLYDFGTDHAILTPLLYRGYLRRRKERFTWQENSI